MRTYCLFVVAFAAVLLFGRSPTLACACCTHPAQRMIATAELEPFHRDEIGRLRFASEASLLLGEANDEGLPGLPEPEESWSLSVKQQKNRLVFSLRDGNSHAGTLSVVLPKTFSVFMTDTRDGEDKGYGPPLYTEWTLSAPFAGGGVFRPAAAEARRLTLVLQGRGSSCPGAETFTHWILSFGPHDKFKFYGSLTEAKK